MKPLERSTAQPQSKYGRLSRRTVWTIRLVLLGLLAIWVAGAVYLHQDVAEKRAKRERAQAEFNRREEFLRRGTQYRQQLKEFEDRSRARTLDGR